MKKNTSSCVQNNCISASHFGSLIINIFQLIIFHPKKVSRNFERTNACHVEQPLPNCVIKCGACGDCWTATDCVTSYTIDRWRAPEFRVVSSHNERIWYWCVRSRQTINRDHCVNMMEPHPSILTQKVVTERSSVAATSLHINTHALRTHYIKCNNKFPTNAVAGDQCVISDRVVVWRTVVDRVAIGGRHISLSAAHCRVREKCVIGTSRIVRWFSWRCQWAACRHYKLNIRI